MVCFMISGSAWGDDLIPFRFKFRLPLCVFLFLLIESSCSSNPMMFEVFSPSVLLSVVKPQLQNLEPSGLNVCKQYNNQKPQMLWCLSKQRDVLRHLWSYTSDLINHPVEEHLGCSPVCADEIQLGSTARSRLVAPSRSVFALDVYPAVS